jgi:hypothetical protein
MPEKGDYLQIDGESNEVWLGQVESVHKGVSTQLCLLRVPRYLYCTYKEDTILPERMQEMSIAWLYTAQDIFAEFDSQLFGKTGNNYDGEVPQRCVDF